MDSWQNSTSKWWSIFSSIFLKLKNIFGKFSKFRFYKEIYYIFLIYRSVKNTPPLRSKSSQFFSGGFIFAKILSNFVLAVYSCQNFRIQIEQNWRFSTTKSIFGELIFQNFRLRRFFAKKFPNFSLAVLFLPKILQMFGGGVK